MSVRARLVALAACAFVPIAVLGTVASTHQFGVLEDRLLDEAVLAARGVASDIDESLLRLAAAARAAAVVYEVTGGDDTGLEALQRALASELDRLLIVSASGEVISAARHAPGGESRLEHANSPWLRSAIRQRLSVYAGPVLAPGGNESEWLAAVPFLPASGHRLAAAIATVRMSQLERAIRARLATEYRFVLLDDVGEVVAGSDPSSVRPWPNAELRNLVASRSSRATRALLRIEDQTYAGALARVADGQWHIVVAIPRGPAFAAYWQSNRANATIGAIVLIAVLALALRIAASLLRIHRVVRGSIHRVALGDYSHRMPITGSPDDNDVARDFNRMAGRLARASAELTHSQQRYRSLLALSSDWHWETDREHRIVYLSEDAAQRSGFSRPIMDVARWQLPGVDLPGNQWQAHRRTLDAREPFRDFEYARLSENGEPRWSSISGEPTFDAQGDFTGFRGVGHDITEKKRIALDLERQARYDPLTGLANRTLLRSRLDDAVSANDHAQVTALLLLDLDGFKLINDALGHDVGDGVLKTLATRLADAVRTDDVVARLGGDEFVVMLRDAHGEEEVSRIAEKLLLALRETIAVDGREFVLTASIGVALAPRDGEDSETLLKNADAAMYRAKEAGRNTVRHYSPEMNLRGARLLSMRNDLARALDRAEFELHYQPIVDAHDGRVVSAEALLRWRRADGLQISPAEFIPVAEETGLILPIGLWVLETACANARQWNSGGLPNVAVAVNLSARQFRQRDLVRQVERILLTEALAPHLLKLEITESAVMDDPHEAVRVVAALGELGVRISIDDFGTGHSSLAYLKRFEAAEIKIDRAFVTGLPTVRDDVAIVRATIALAHEIGMTVVAEGVETPEQLAFLRHQKCDAFQGYLLARPGRIAELYRYAREAPAAFSAMVPASSRTV